MMVGLQPWAYSSSIQDTDIRDGDEENDPLRVRSGRGRSNWMGGGATKVGGPTAVGLQEQHTRYEQQEWVPIYVHN